MGKASNVRQRFGAQPNEETSGSNADKAKAVLKNKGKGFQLPSEIRQYKELIMFTLASLILAGLVYSIWPSSGYRSGRERVPDGMESLTAFRKIPGIPVAKAFEYLRTPETWVYWKADTSKVAGAVDRALNAGMRFMEQTTVEGVERDVTWVTTHAGVDATSTTKMKVQMTGRIKDVSERGLRSTYLVANTGKNSTHEEATVTQTLYFGHKGLDAEQRKAVRKTHKAQMDLSLAR